MCLFVRGKYLFMSLNCLFVRHKRVFVGKVKLRTYLTQNFNLRTSEAHFIKKSAVRGTAATCDSLVSKRGRNPPEDGVLVVGAEHPLSDHQRLLIPLLPIHW